MTQQSYPGGYAPPAQQQYPPQQPAQQFVPQFPVQPQQQAYPQQYPPQQQGYGQIPAQQPPAQPLAQGSIDDFYNQPSTGGGPSISWSNKDGSQKPVGSSYAGVVTRDVTASDVQQETDYKTQQPKFYRDGRPKFVMKVPLQVNPSQEHPDGEAALYVKGQTRDELVRAMSEAGVDGAPKAGALIEITLVNRKPMGQGMNPANVVAIRYTPAGGQPPAPAPQAPSAPSPALGAQPVAQAQAPVPQQPAAQAPQVAQPPAPAQQLPEGLTPDQAALFQRLSGQQQG